MKYRKLLCVAMVLALLLGLSGSGLALTLDTITTGPMGTVTGIVEEKIYSKATLEDDFADDRVLVVLNNAASLKLKTYTAADFPEISCASVSDLSTATKARVSAKLKGEDIAAACGAKSDSIVFSDFYEVDVQKYNQILCLTLPTAGKQNVLAAMKLLMQREDVMYAGPDYPMELFRTPNDAKYSQQQMHYNKISLPQAWDITTGSSTIYVGVIDSGIDGQHVDLRDNIDVSKSCDFTSGYYAPADPVIDLYGHGTEVAGIIGAKGNNYSGISGVAWNVKLVSIRVHSTGPSHSSTNVINAINYASSMGIPIINYSGGGTYDDPAYYTAIENYNGLLVCAAGNQGSNNDSTPIFPASYTYSNIISVGASTTTSTNDQPRANSNYGATSVDIFAPGTDIWTTGTNNRYIPSGATSIAAPFVSGLAALMLTECPSITVATMKSRIMNYADKLSAFAGKCVSGGRINAYMALKNAHTFNYTYTSSSHTGRCSCGEVRTETHTFTNIGVQYVCITCGYTTTSP